MTIAERVLDALKDVKASNYDKAPPLHRFCWRHGLLIPPPMLASFWFNVALLGIFFGVTWGLVMAMLLAFGVLGARVPVPVLLGTMPITALGAGVFFGLFMAIYARVKTRHHELPSWQSLVEAERNKDRAIHSSP